MTRQTAKSAPNRIPWLACSIVALLALALFLPTISFDFTFDDRVIVAGNPAVQQRGQWKLIFLSDYWPGDHSALYRPFTILSLALERMIHGPAPAGFHLTNVLLHAGVSAMVFLIGAELFGPGRAAALAGALFAVHPLHTEAVSGVVGRAELLSSFLSLLVLWIWMRQANEARPPLGASVQMFLFFFLALGSKENAIILPLAIILWEVSRRENGKRAAGLLQLVRNRRLWGLIGVALVFLSLRAGVLGGLEESFDPKPPFVENPLAHQTASVRVLNAAANQTRALLLHVYPRPLIADYSYKTLASVSSWRDLHAIAMLFFTAACLSLWRLPGRSAGAAFAFSWYLVAILPTSNIPFPIGTIFAERLSYFPSVGFCLGVGALFSLFVGRSVREWEMPDSIAGKLLLGLSVAAIVTLSAATWIRNPVWENNLALFTDAVAKAPSNVKARLWLGDALVQSGEFDRSIAQYRQALEIYPEYAPAAANMVVPLYELGRHREAIDYGERARAGFGKENPILLHNLAQAYLQMGDSVRFLEYMDRSLTIHPANPEAHVALGRYYFQHAGNRELAKKHFETALRLDPNLQEGAWIRSLYPSR